MTRAVSQHRRRHMVSRGASPHHLWPWLVMALGLGLAILWMESAAAQTVRGSELIARALGLEPNEKNGAALYQEHCASCHGKNARGNTKLVTPSLAGQLQRYLIKQLVDFAEGDRTAPEMHRIVSQKQLTEPQAMRDLASYLNSLRLNPTPERGDGKQLALGRRVYESACAQCHGPQAEGEDVHAVPSLQRQHYSYLLAQMRKLAVGHRYSVDIDVIEILEALSFDQLTAVADYLSRLPMQPIHTPAARSAPQAGRCTDPLIRSDRSAECSLPRYRIAARR